ncbi:hypothetical protein IH979_01065 [Patescibacteria group bacterium]|nr:hypothetical protein [Patescibacteria group bacterium]
MLLQVCDLAKNLAFLAALISKGDDYSDEIREFLRPKLVGDEPELDADIAIALRHISCTLAHHWKFLERKRRRGLIITLGQRINRGSINNRELSAFFCSIFEPDSQHPGAGSLAKALAFLAPLINEECLEPARLHAWLSPGLREETYRLDPDVSLALRHVTVVIHRKWSKLSGLQKNRLSTQLCLRVNRGMISSNQLDELYEELLPA